MNFNLYIDWLHHSNRQLYLLELLTDHRQRNERLVLNVDKVILISVLFVISSEISVSLIFSHFFFFSVNIFISLIRSIRYSEICLQRNVSRSVELCVSLPSYNYMKILMAFGAIFLDISTNHHSDFHTAFVKDTHSSTDLLTFCYREILL